MASHSLTDREAKRVIQESRKSNQEIIKKALSKFVTLNNTTNTRPPTTSRPVATSTTNVRPPATSHPVGTSTTNSRQLATTITNTRKTQQVVRTSPPKRERHWLGVLLELV